MRNVTTLPKPYYHIYSESHLRAHGKTRNATLMALGEEVRIASSTTNDLYCSVAYLGSKTRGFRVVSATHRTVKETQRHQNRS